MSIVPIRGLFESHLKHRTTVYSAVTDRTNRFRDPKTGKTLVFLTNMTAQPASAICDLQIMQWFAADAPRGGAGAVALLLMDSIDYVVPK